MGVTETMLPDPSGFSKKLGILAERYVPTVVRALRWVGSNSRSVQFGLFVASVIGLGVAWVVGDRWGNGSDARSASLLEIEMMPNRYLVVVADVDGFYCGKFRLPDGEEAVHLAAEARIRKVNHVLVVGTAGANYGKVIKLIGQLDQNSLRLYSIATYPVAVGSRLPEVDRSWGCF